MLHGSRISGRVSLILFRALLLCLEPPVTSGSNSAHLDSLSDLVLELILIIVIVVNGLLHLATRTHNVLFFFIVQLIVNFFTVVVKGIIYILLFDFIFIVVNTLNVSHI